jgi:hypothetical protein
MMMSSIVCDWQRAAAGNDFAKLQTNCSTGERGNRSLPFVTSGDKLENETSKQTAGLALIENVSCCENSTTGQLRSGRDGMKAVESHPAWIGREIERECTSDSNYHVGRLGPDTANSAAIFREDKISAANEHSPNPGTEAAVEAVFLAAAKDTSLWGSEVMMCLSLSWHTRSHLASGRSFQYI